MRWTMLMVLALLAGCAGLLPGERPAVTPAMLAADPGLVPKGTPLQWSGVIVERRLSGGHTVLRLVAYPSDGEGRPRVTAASLGQFLADRPGELAEAQYGVGRQLRVTGPLLGHADGDLAGRPYRFPAIGAEQLVLWNDNGASRRAPDVRFGVGVGSGGPAWGVGVGVGF
jgi:starvation-inducible outer membrane lipoprotein